MSGQLLGQATPGAASIKTPTSAAQPWEYTLTVGGYIVPEGTSYVNPVLTADHRWLHLEACYNDEDLRTGSLWVGYNFSRGEVSAGDKWEFDITPMIGGVFGRLNGIAPGCEASLSYRKKVELSITNEYVNMCSIPRASQGTFTTPGRSSRTRRWNGFMWVRWCNIPRPTTPRSTSSEGSWWASPTRVGVHYRCFRSRDCGYDGSA